MSSCLESIFANCFGENNQNSFNFFCCTKSARKAHERVVAEQLKSEHEEVTRSLIEKDFQIKELTEKTEEKLRAKDDTIESTAREIKTLQDSFNETTKKLTESQQNEKNLTAEIENLKRKISILETENAEFIEDNEIAAKVHDNQILGHYLVSNFKIQDIKHLVDINNVVLSGEIVNKIGKWRVLLFRNENGHLSAILLMVKGVAGFYQYQIELLNKDSMKNQGVAAKEYLRIMWPSNTLDVMEYLKMADENYLNTDEDCLSIKFSIRTAQDESLRLTSLVPRLHSHKILIRDFKQWIDNDIDMHSDTFYDKFGYCWKLLMYRYISEEDGETYTSAYFYLLNGLYNMTYDFQLEILHPDHKKNIYDCGNHIFRTPAKNFGYDNFASINRITSGGYLNPDGGLELHVRIKMAGSETENYYLGRFARAVFENNFTSTTFKVENFMEKRCKEEKVFGPKIKDEFGNVWCCQVFTNGSDSIRGRFLSVFVYLAEGAPGDYEYILELLHEDTVKVINRTAKRTFEIQGSWGIPHMANLQKVVNEGYINQDKSVVFRFAVRPLSTTLRDIYMQRKSKDKNYSGNLH